MADPHGGKGVPILQAMGLREIHLTKVEDLNSRISLSLFLSLGCSAISNSNQLQQDITHVWISCVVGSRGRLVSNYKEKPKRTSDECHCN